MTHLLFVICSGLFLLLFSPPNIAHAETPDIESILKKADDLYRREHSIMQMEMYVKTSKYERKMSMEATSLGTEKSLIKIISPAKDAGTITLKVDKNMWNYLPKVDRTMKIPSGMMGGSWMGSHFSNGDLVREDRFSEDFDAKFLQVPGDKGEDVFVIEMIPKPDTPVVWGKIVSKNASDYVPMEVSYYDEDGTLMRIDKFEDIKEIDGIRMPMSFLILPQDKPGEMTKITYTKVDFTTEVDPKMFSLQALRK